jgi:anti-sigma factor RsiW
MTQPSSSDAHLEVDQVVGYLAGTLSSAERARVQAHLADCAECTSELVEVNRLRRPVRARARWLVPAAAAAAAAIVLVVVGPRLARDGSESPSPIRGGEGGPAVSVVAPADGSELPGLPTFTWRGVPGATAYRLSVSRADGDSVWAATVRDTSARAPESSTLPAPDVYYWYVDVLLADGRSIAGTAHEFRVTR